MATKLLDEYLCKGPRLKDPAEVAEAHKRLLHKNVRALLKTDKTDEEKIEILKGVEAAFIRDPRQACGFRMNEVLEALPEDGLEYDAVCPKCGTKTATTRTPPDPV